MGAFNLKKIRKLCFVLCVFVTLVSFVIYERISNKAKITLSFEMHDQSPEPGSTHVTVNHTGCPCPLGLEKVKVLPKEIETNMTALIQHFHKNSMHKARLDVGKRKETVDQEFEAPLFAYPPLEHSDCLPHRRSSKVVLLTPHENISTGSRVQFRVDLYNSKGQSRCTGGDEVRAWLKSQDGRSAIAAEVKDLQNGSYVGETVLPWPGVTYLWVSLTYPHEFLRYSVEMLHTFLSMRYTAQYFKSGAISETVPCLPSYPIPGYAKFCNFTASNGDYPWYCAHPVTRPLNCSHRHATYSLSFQWLTPIPAQYEWFNDNHYLMIKSHRSDLELIPNDVKLEVRSESAAAPHPLPPCHSRPVRESWLSASPRGWRRNGTWVDAGCALPDLDKQTVARCLQNTTLMLLGDSNQRIVWRFMLDFMNCTTLKQARRHDPHVCLNDELRSALLFAVHSYPFSPGVNRGYQLNNLPLPMALNFAENLSYPDSHKLVMVIQYYLHQLIYPVSVYRTIIQKTRKTMQEYLKMHPKVKFVVRGPHVIFEGKLLSSIGDKVARWYKRILQKEFAELRDRVWYMDTWDLTLTAENRQLHPHTVLRDMVKILLGYICDDL